MKYGFIKLKNDDGKVEYMEVRNFERFYNYDVFKNHAVALVVYNGIYIGAFPLIFKVSEIYEYNPDAELSTELNLNDIAFSYSSVSSVAKQLGCEN